MNKPLKKEEFEKMGKLRKRRDRGNSEMESTLRERNPATTKPVENVQASWGG